MLDPAFASGTAEVRNIARMATRVAAASVAAAMVVTDWAVIDLNIVGPSAPWRAWSNNVHISSKVPIFGPIVCSSAREFLNRSVKWADYANNHSQSTKFINPGHKVLLPHHDHHRNFFLHEDLSLQVKGKSMTLHIFALKPATLLTAAGAALWIGSAAARITPAFLDWNRFGWSRGMAVELVKQKWAAYLRVQANHCQRLSRNCMDLGTARDLRLMADEYFVEASKIEARTSGPEPQWGLKVWFGMRGNKFPVQSLWLE
jgi:hypothetical protein